MRDYAINNLWGMGAPVEVPDEAVAVYAGRWIDQGDLMRPDVVPDRQGFAYDDPAQRDNLIRLMGKANLGESATRIDRDDDAHPLVNMGSSFQFFARRAGGYFYVKGWIT